MKCEELFFFFKGEMLWLDVYEVGVEKTEVK